MHPGPATHARRHPFAWVALLAACSAAPARYQPGRLAEGQIAVLRAAEAAYRAEQADYAVRRAEVWRDPDATGWLVRMFVHDVIAVREQRPLGSRPEELARRAAGQDPVERRAVEEIRAAGPGAVPVLVGDLLLDDQPLRRELGIELLAEVGVAARPALFEVARTGPVKSRRAAARTLGLIGLDEPTLQLLVEMLADPDYTVRADAVRGLGSGGVAGLPRLLAHLDVERDPFVLRMVVQTLGEMRLRASGEALVARLDRCIVGGDDEGERAAQVALQRLTATRGVRSVAAWRELVKSMPDNPPNERPATRKDRDG